MKTRRNPRATGSAPIVGYRPTDVEERLRALRVRRGIVESALVQEREAFRELYRRKGIELDHLRQLLEDALEEERLLLDGGERP